MKKIILLLLLLFTGFYSFSQNDKVNIKFVVNLKTELWIGKEWDYNYEKLNKPLIVSFDEKKLNISYENGDEFWDINVISYTKKIKKDYDKIEKELYTLKIIDGNYIIYVLIEKDYTSVLYEYTYEIKIPFIYNGEIMNYNYYRSN